MRQGRQLLVGPTSVVDDARERHWEPATSRLISGCACITTVQHVASKSHRYCAHSRKPIPVLRRRCAQRTCRSAMDACSACNIVGSKLTGCFFRSDHGVPNVRCGNARFVILLYVNSQQNSSVNKMGHNTNNSYSKIVTTNNVWLLPLCCAGLVVQK